MMLSTTTQDNSVTLLLWQWSLLMDGEKVMQIVYFGVGRYFFLHFCATGSSATGSTKYAFEALRLQLQLHTLSPDLVTQLKYGWFVNTHGGIGRNIPCDLHCEHMVRLFKDTVHNMGSNFTEQSSTRVARSLTTLNSIATKFDSECCIHPESTAHTGRSNTEDIKLVVNTVLRRNLLALSYSIKYVWPVWRQRYNLTTSHV